MKSYTRFKGFVVAFVWVAASVSAAASTLFLDDYSQNTIDNYTQLWKTASNKGVFTHNAAQSTLDYNRTNSAVSAWHTDLLLLKETTFSIANLNRFVVRAQITFSNEISTAQAGIVIAASPDTPAGVVIHRRDVSGGRWVSALMTSSSTWDTAQHANLSEALAPLGTYDITVVYDRRGDDLILDVDIAGPNSQTWRNRRTFPASTLGRSAKTYGGSQIGWWLRHGTNTVRNALGYLEVATAGLVVTNAADGGAGTLRQAIADSLHGDWISFAPSLQGSSIPLTSGQIVIDKSLWIDGPGPDKLALDGKGLSRIFYLTDQKGGIGVRITGLALTNGVETSRGGAIRTDSSWNSPGVTLSLSNCVIRANRVTASNNGDGGGGIHYARGPLHVRLGLVDCDISDNRSGGTGGGLWLGMHADIDRCTISGNTGGGVFIWQHGSQTIRNSTISGNEALTAEGSGLFKRNPNSGDKVQVFNSTIYGNRAPSHECAGFRVNASETAALIVSSLVSGNTDNSGGRDVAGTFAGVTNCLISVTNGVALPGANNILGLPAPLDSLADNGGLTRTHALPRKSPAIDKGSNPLALATDQRGPGFPRLLGAAVDIGAYEYLPPPPATIICVQ